MINNPIKLMYFYQLNYPIHTVPDRDIMDLDLYVNRIAKRMRKSHKLVSSYHKECKIKVLENIIKNNVDWRIGWSWYR